jgi:hypothetical protein
MLQIACSPGAWPSATCVLFSFTTAAGTNTTIYPGTSPYKAKGTDQPSAALVQGKTDRVRVWKPGSHDI